MTDSRLDKMQQMAQRFHATGTVDKTTMRTIDALVAQTKLEDMTSKGKSHHDMKQADSETLERWKAYKENGETISNEAMMDWLDTW
ncbi:MAG: putative transcriptional regulator [Phenylobacterium sp.]|jgi:predicted transcriptional regulator